MAALTSTRGGGDGVRGKKKKVVYPLSPGLSKHEDPV